MITPGEVTGVVLAGGRSSRFGSNKAMAVYDRQTLLQRALRLLQPFCREVVVGGEYPEYRSVPNRRLPDLVPGLGPLGGIHTALKHCATPYLLLLPCDMPLTDDTLLQRLLREAGSNDELLAWQQEDGTLQFFPMLLSVRLLPTVETLLAAGRLSLKGLLPLSESRLLSVRPEEEALFTNVNRRDDLDKLIKQE